MKKRLLCVLIATLLCLITVTPATASVVITPLWLNINSISLSLSYGSNKANVGCNINAKVDTASISADFVLQEQNGSSWSTVYTWPTQTATGRYLFFSDSVAATQGKTYRFKVTAKVTNTAGVSETVTDYIDKKYN